MTARTLRILRGDLTLRVADALATSANPTLSGNANPDYWRFVGYASVDGALRERAGPAFAELVAASRPARALEPGETHTTPSAGEIAARCAIVIHAVVPDGLYGEQGRGGELKQTYAAVLEAAAAAGARSLACPALGCGVQGHRPAFAARQAFAAAGAWLDGSVTPGAQLSEVDLVCFADDVWAAWPACAVKFLGDPSSRSELSLEWHRFKT